MPYRRTRRVVARNAPSGITIPFGSVVFTESVGNQDLLLPEGLGSELHRPHPGLPQCFSCHRRRDFPAANGCEDFRGQLFSGHLHGWCQRDRCAGLHHLLGHVR